jgi:hypothetical protein
VNPPKLKPPTLSSHPPTQPHAKAYRYHRIVVSIVVVIIVVDDGVLQQIVKYTA